MGTKASIDGLEYIAPNKEIRFRDWLGGGRVFTDAIVNEEELEAKINSLKNAAHQNEKELEAKINNLKNEVHQNEENIKKKD